MPVQPLPDTSSQVHDSPLLTAVCHPPLYYFPTHMLIPFLLNETPVFSIVLLGTCVIKTFPSIVAFMVQSVKETFPKTDPIVSPWEILWWPPTYPPAPIYLLVNFFILFSLLQLIHNSYVNKFLHSRWQIQYFTESHVDISLLLLFRELAQLFFQLKVSA